MGINLGKIMRDLFLEALIKGGGGMPKYRETAVLLTNEESKDRFEIAIDADIENYLNTTLSDDADPLSKKLLSLEAKRARIKAEFKEALELKELRAQISTALHIFIDEGKKILSSTDYNLAIEEFASALSVLENMDLEGEISSDLKTLLNVSPKTLDALLALSSAKFTEENYSDSLALAVFLSILDSQNAINWYRAAIAAQQDGKIDFAIRAYEAAFYLDSTLIGAKVFACQCYLSLGRKEEAKATLDEAANIVKTSALGEPWPELLISLQLQIEKGR